METDPVQQKHRCKICSKGFASGRSLGGHMRSHMRSSCLDAEEKEKLESGQGSYRAGYDLRENPKKTWRLSDFIGEGIVSASKLCNECGKEFPSWKAFFDHIEFHSEITCNQSMGEVEPEEQEDGSWSLRKYSIESFFGGDGPLSLPAVPGRKRRSNRAPTIVAASSSTITDYESEQEDVAISLMMLSRDTGGFWVTGVSSADESSDKNSVVEEHRDEEVSGKSKAKIAMVAKDKKSGSRYQCATCNKSFLSYHALGGHRASHKRTRSCCLLKANDESIKNAGFGNATAVEHFVGLNQKSVVHECIICGKVFSSGHALGGHKKSHLVCNGGNGGLVVSEVLDLNIPAQVEEEPGSFKNEQHPASSFFD